MAGPLITLGLGSLTTSRDYEFLWAEEAGQGPLKLLTESTRVQVPIRVGLVVALAASVIFLRCAFRRLARWKSVCLAISLVAFGGTMVAAAQLRRWVIPAVRGASLSALAAPPFTPAQWSAARDYVRNIPDDWLRPRAFVPYDPHLLDRVTFVGLSVGQLEAVLGQGIASLPPSQSFDLVLAMVPPPRCGSASLTLHTEYNERMELQVTYERVEAGRLTRRFSGRQGRPLAVPAAAELQFR